MIVILSGICFAQNVRYDTQFPSITTIGATPYLVANVTPPVTLAVCHSPANAVPCTNFATTFNGVGTACPNGAQDTPQPATTSACQPTGDSKSNIGFWAPAGTYDYTVCIATSCFGPFTVTLNTTSGTGFPAAQIGDIVRFNVNNDNNWDAVNAAINFINVNEVLGGCGNNAPNSSGIYGTGATRVLGPSGIVPTGIAPTNTVPAGCQMTSSSGASTVYLAGWFGYQNGNNSTLPIRAWYRTSFRLSVTATANSRYWFGLGTWNNGSGLGTNGTTFAQAGNTKYATDTPNSNTIGFRFSNGTDTHWQAAAITAGGSTTLVDTGVTPDGNVHLFEMAMNIASTTVTFYIDNVLVATISTNIPPTGTASQGDAAVDLFMLEDNKNVAAAVTFTFYDCHMSLR